MTNTTKYVCFGTVFNSNGRVFHGEEIQTTFSNAKRIAIDTVKLMYERYHGRGNHGVKLYGMVEYNTQSEYVWVRDELVFEF